MRKLNLPTNDDLLYDELEFESILDIEEAKNFEQLDEYYLDYLDSEQDLTKLIRSGK